MDLFIDRETSSRMTAKAASLNTTRHARGAARPMQTAEPGTHAVGEAAHDARTQLPCAECASESSPRLTPWKTALAAQSRSPHAADRPPPRCADRPGNRAADR